MTDLRAILPLLTPEQRASVTEPLAEFTASLVQDVIDGIDEEALAVELHGLITEGMKAHVAEVARDPWNHLPREDCERMHAAIAETIVAALEKDK